MPIFPPENQTKTKTKTKTIVKAALIAAGIGLAAAGFLGLRQFNSRARLNRSSPRTPAVSAPAPAITPLNSNSDVRVELDMPDYLPKELRQPQKLFAGRTLIIASKNPFSEQEVALISKKTNEKHVLPLKKQKGPSAFTVNLPQDAPTGGYTLSVLLDGKEYEFLLNMEGDATTTGLRLPAPPLEQATTTELEQKVIRYQNKICDGCFWEAALTGAPDDSDKLFFVDGGIINRSTDGGRVWVSERIDDISNYPYSDMWYLGDPKIVALPDGSFYLSSIFSKRFLNGGVAGGAIYKGRPIGSLEVSLFQDVQLSAGDIANDFDDFILFTDRPNLAIDNSVFPISIYIAGNGVWYDDTQKTGGGIYASKDGGKTFQKYKMQKHPGAILSLVAGPGGIVYGTRRVITGSSLRNLKVNIEIVRFVSFNPFKFDVVRIDREMADGFPRVASYDDYSKVALWSYVGPEIVADNNKNSSHRGRLYIVWSEPEKNVEDSDFEYTKYGYNFNVFVSYSDDKGNTWSAPVKVNDDSGAGDQFFPSAKLDSNGRLHIAFLDHRNNQDLPVVDVYYTSTADGVSFSKNIKVNNASIPIGSGGRVLGDYLDMVMPYPDKVYIAYPCGANGNNTAPSAACLTEIDPTYAYAPLAPGDVNKNGRVDIGDALFVAQYLAEKRQLDYSQTIAADVYSDGKITSDSKITMDDADVIAQYNVGIIKKLPCVYLAGDINCDGNIDCQDLSDLNSMFKDRMTPSVVSDVNGDGQRATLGDIQKLVDIFGEKGITNCGAAASTPFSEKWSDVSINASCNPNKFNVGFVLITPDINSPNTEKSLSLLQELRSDFVNYFYEATYRLASANVSDVVVTTKGAEDASNGGVSILEAAKELISARGDKFDFIAIFTTYDTWNNNHFDQNYFSLKNNVKNIGARAIINDQEKEIFNQSALAGSSGKLKGISFHDDIMLKLCDKNPTIDGKPCGVGGLLHELGHQWCCYIGENFIGNGSERLGIIQEGQHFYLGLDSYPDTADPLGSYHWIPNSDETYRQQTAGYNIRYHPIFLYLMGLLPKYEYDTKFQIFNAGVFGSTLDINKATKYTTVSVNDVIRIMGQRSCGN